MFLLNVSQSLILGVVPESLGVLIFGVGLILLTIVLRRFMKRSEKNADYELEKIAEKVNR